VQVARKALRIAGRRSCMVAIRLDDPLRGFFQFPVGSAEAQALALAGEDSIEVLTSDAQGGSVPTNTRKPDCSFFLAFLHSCMQHESTLYLLW
jgi:hypothetical protein